MSFLPKIQYVKSAGPPSAKLAFVGEAPDEKEEREGIPFIGPAGQMLDKLLTDAGILRRDVYITNVIKERPADNDIKQFIDLTKKFPIITPEGQSYIQQLREELSSISANCIVPLGNTVLFALTELRGIIKWRGSIIPSLDGRKLVPTYHPRVLIGKEAMYLWRYPMMWDLKRALEQSEFPEIREQPADLRIKPNFEDTCAWLDSLAGVPIVDVDIEVLREEISCIALGHGTSVMSIPFVDHNGDYWNPEQELVIWRKIARILEDPNIQIRGQNFISFDSSFIHTKYGIRTVNILDTMVAQGILFPELPKGLDYLCSVYSNIPYYKDEGKKWNRLYHPFEQHWLYNAKDSLATAVIHPVLEEQITRHGNYETYKRQEKLAGPLLFMSRRGVRMDIQALTAAHESVVKALENFEQSLFKEVGYEINYNSPPQLLKYFYTEKGFKPYIDRKTKRPTTNRTALKRLARKSPAAKILMEIRRLEKLRSTYLEVNLDSDNRLRCSFNPVGTKFGRISSSKTIFDTGMNMQNQPDIMRLFMLYDEDYIGYNVDLSQAENRIVAYVGPVPEMIEAFEAGKDVHSLTASLIFGNLTPEQIKQMDKEDIRCTEIAGGTYTHRFYGKKSNHGLNYDEGPYTFAETLEIDNAEVKFIVDRYHQIYPGVRQGFQQQVRNMLSRNRTITNCMDRKILFLDRWGDKLFKDAYASVPQSTVSDIINERGLEYLWDNQDIFRSVEILLLIHDSIMFQIPKSVPLTEHAHILMLLKNSLEIPINWKSREFVIPADFQLSLTNMSNGKDGGLRDIPATAFSSHQTLTEKLGELTNAAPTR